MKASISEGVVTLTPESEVENMELLLWHGEFKFQLQTVDLAVVEYREAASGACEVE